MKYIYILIGLILLYLTELHFEYVISGDYFNILTIAISTTILIIFWLIYILQTIKLINKKI